MELTNRKIRALLKKQYHDDCVNDTEYVHYEMFVNMLLGSNISRELKWSKRFPKNKKNNQK
tara:strand:+ start:596 stop:778 length:183 start_codon:yes stop_codon:yes gene_type:complete